MAKSMSDAHSAAAAAVREHANALKELASAQRGAGRGHASGAAVRALAKQLLNEEAVRDHVLPVINKVKKLGG